VVRFLFPVQGGHGDRAGRDRRRPPDPAAGGGRAPGADPAVRSFGAARTCAADGCETKLSRYNPDSFCSVHRGWDRQVVTRRRRAEEAEDEG
jgi:hypothetical protein